MKKEQRRKYEKDYWGKRREHRRALSRAWRLANPEKRRAYYLKTCYGMTPEAFASMLAGQGGVCAACGSAEWGPHGPAVDHNHEAGTIRGILCHKCNIALGLIEDDPARARALADYLERKD